MTTPEILFLAWATWAIVSVIVAVILLRFREPKDKHRGENR
jgi:hypothetical protein